MSSVVSFNGGFNWTIKDALSGVLNKSEPFIVDINGEEVTFSLSSANVPAEYLDQMYHQTTARHGQQLFRTGYRGQQVAIYVQSLTPVDLVPTLELLEDDGSWYNLPINWIGPDGIDSDKMFFGSTKFMANDKLRDEYMKNDHLTIKCTLIPPGPVILSANSELLDDLEDMFENGTQADIVLVSEGKELKALKGILAGRSSVFLAMFEHKLDEVESGRVNITDVEYEPLRALVKFLYTGMIELEDAKFALKIFVAADKYDVQSLKSLVETYISKNIVSACFIEAIHIGQTLNSAVIKTACLKSIAIMKKSDVLAIPGFNELDRDLFIEVVGQICETLNGQ